jgi:hypothetical protein
VHDWIAATPSQLVITVFVLPSVSSASVFEINGLAIEPQPVPANKKADEGQI